MWEFAQRITLAITTISLLIGFVWVWNVLQKDSTYPIRTVRFVGTYHHLKPKELEQAASPYVATGFFAVNSNALQRSINKIPWIYSTEVYRRWPDTLEIRFQEQQAVARWEETAVMNVHGEIFEPESESIPATLPSFYGELAQAKSILDSYFALEKIVQKETLRIKEIHVSPSDSWTVVFRNDLTVKLGRKDQQRRMRRLMESYHGVFKSKLHAVESVDLRYPSGMAVKWRRQEKNKQKSIEFARSTHPNVKENG